LCSHASHLSPSPSLCNRPTARESSNSADARPSSSSSSSSDGSGGGSGSSGRSTSTAGTEATVTAPDDVEIEYATLRVQRLLKRRLDDEVPMAMIPSARRDALRPLFATDETPEQEAVMFNEMMGGQALSSPEDAMPRTATPTS
jgi:hypothetical protein